jgi:hypothetical protein
MRRNHNVKNGFRQKMKIFLKKINLILFPKFSNYYNDVYLGGGNVKKR